MKLVVQALLIAGHTWLGFCFDSASSKSGEVSIAIEVVKATDQITLNAAELTISKAEFVSGNESPLASREVTYNSARETATLIFPSTLPVGKGVLHLIFEGVLNDQLKGYSLLFTFQTRENLHQPLLDSIEASTLTQRRRRHTWLLHNSNLLTRGDASLVGMSPRWKPRSTWHWWFRAIFKPFRTCPLYVNVFLPSRAVINPLDIF